MIRLIVLAVGLQIFMMTFYLNLTNATDNLGNINKPSINKEVVTQPVATVSLPSNIKPSELSQISRQLDDKTRNIVLVISLIVSISLSIYTVMHNIRQRKLLALSNNLNAILSAEEMISNSTNLLRFHGIEKDELDAAGLTSEDLCYLLKSFTAGGLYYKITCPKDTSAFSKSKYPDSYRYRMCELASTRRAWPILEKLMSDSNYKKRISETVDLLNKECGA